MAKDEKLVCVVFIGYGSTQGVPHKSKEMDALCTTNGEPMKDWFRKGMEMVLLAPSAMNQQDFFFTMIDDTVNATSLEKRYSKVDLGIAKYHFEVGAGKENFEWQQ